MTDIFDRIDEALSCAACGNPLPARACSDDWCSDLCYRTWCEQVNGTIAERVSIASDAEAAYQPAWVTYPLDQGVYEPLPPSEPPRASMLRDSSHLLLALGAFVAGWFARRPK